MSDYIKLNHVSDKACIIGVGQTEFSKASGQSVAALALQASRAAISDAGLKPPDIDAILPYAVGPTADEMAAQLGIADLRYSSMIKMGGATPVANLLVAAMLIFTGVAKNVLMFCARNGRSGARVDARMGVMPGQTFRRDFEHPYGWTVPGQWYAMLARRHMIEFGTQREAAADFALAMRRHANLNPHAMMFNTPMTKDDYLQSRPVYDPFLLFDCCLETDGAAAYVVTSASAARDMPHKPVFISGAAQAKPMGSDDLVNRPNVFDIGLTKAAPRAFEMAGVQPADMDGAMVYDCFTYVALLELEEAGFCPRGSVGEFVRNGNIELGGKLPINTHGGLLSEAHIAGMGHVIEAVHQLRGNCGDRQIAHAQHIAVTGWGDLGDGAMAILRN